MTKWIKLAIVAFVGVLIASLALGVTNSLGADTAGSMAGMSNMSGMANMSGTNGMSVMSGYPYGGTDMQSQNHAAHYAGAQQGGSGLSAAETQIYMMQYQIQQLQQQLSYLMQRYNQQGYYPGPMGMPGYMSQMPNTGMNNMNQMNNMNNMNNSSMNGQSGSGSNSSGGMGMM